MSTTKLQRAFALPTSPSKHPIKVIDNVLPVSWCNDMIHMNEKIGFGTVPSLQEQRHRSHPESYVGVSVSAPKNTSQMVQLELPTLSEYLWKVLDEYLPLYQYDIPTKGLIKVFEEQSSNSSDGNGEGKSKRIVYEKRHIIPTLRFMRYKPNQGFHVHEDPERLHSHYPCVDTWTRVEKNEQIDHHESHTSKLSLATTTSSATNASPITTTTTTTATTETKFTKHGEVGIFRSLFSVAIYLNDSNEFDGGYLNFVQWKKHTAAGATTSTPRCEQYDVIESIEPKIGRCVIFRHDELHEGANVLEKVSEVGSGSNSAKYMLQCDVLYERIIDV